MERFVFPDDSGVIVSTSDNEIDMADLESFGDTKVGIRSDFSIVVLQKYKIVDRMYRMKRNQWHDSSSVQKR